MNTYYDSFGNRWTTKQIDRLSDKTAKELLQDQIDQHGYNFCENCGRNASGMYLDVSHTISRKESKENGEVEKIWDKSNLEIICRICHNDKDGLNLQFNK